MPKRCLTNKRMLNYADCQGVWKRRKRKTETDGGNGRTENGRGLAIKTPKTKPKPKTLKPSPLTVQSREGILTRAFGPW